jgi:hypothetical protein
MLRDPKPEAFGAGNLAELQRRIRDHNWRIFAEGGQIYAINNTSFHCDTDPFRIFDRMEIADPSHAFYLGYEMMKAKTALTLSKAYRQDQALDWGLLTEPEVSHMARRGEHSPALPESSINQQAEAEGVDASDGPSDENQDRA